MYGGIDGYLRFVVFFCCFSNNRVVIVVNLFLGVIIEFCWLLWVRIDKGGENVEVVCFMVEK